MIVKMSLLSRAFIIATVVAGALSAFADVSGFEHLADISIECGKSAVDSVKPRSLKKRFVCTYENRLCRVLNKKELQFEAYISVDCEVKAVTDKCPSIDVCARPNQLSPSLAEEVRRLNDPNFAGPPDGAETSFAPGEKFDRNRAR